MNLLRAILSVPILPMARSVGWWSNRRDPNARWLSPNDVLLNVEDSWQGFTHRIPGSAWMHRNSENGFNGSSYRPRRQFESSNRDNPFGP